MGKSNEHAHCEIGKGTGILNQKPRKSKTRDGERMTMTRIYTVSTDAARRDCLSLSSSVPVCVCNSVGE